MTNLGPLDSNGMMRNPYGTKFTERQRLAIQEKRAAEVSAAQAKHSAAVAQAEATRERERREAGEQRLEAYRQQCETRWADNGGLEHDFSKAWPALRTQWLADRLTESERRLQEDVQGLRQQPLYQV